MDKIVKEIIDHLISPPYVNSSLIQQVYEEFHLLGHFLNSFKPHNILEIGSKGVTFYLFNKFSTGKKVALDIDENYAKYFLYTENEDFHFICGDSHSNDTFNEVSNVCDNYDFIFIDGDHTLDGVTKDFDMYRSLLSQNGYIGFHDIDPNHILGDRYDCKVHEFWKNLNIGNKIEIVCKRTEVGKIFISGHSIGFGGIGLWRP